MFGSFMNHQLSLVLREPALSQSDPVAPLINSLHELCKESTVAHTRPCALVCEWSNKSYEVTHFVCEVHVPNGYTLFIHAVAGRLPGRAGGNRARVASKTCVAVWPTCETDR